LHVEKYANDVETSLMPATHAQETCSGNLHEKFDASSSQFLAQKQLAGQSRCTVPVMCQRVSVLEQTCSRNLYKKELVPDGLTHVQVSCTRRLAQVS